VDVQRVLEVLSGAGVEHGPLWVLVSLVGHSKGRRGSYEGSGVTGDPGNEDDLVSVRRLSMDLQKKASSVVPLALTASEFVLDIIDSVSGCGVTLVVLGGLELGPEHLVVWVLRDLVDDNLLAVVRDLEDDELGLSAAHAEIIECRDALIIDRDSGVAGSHQYRSIGSEKNIKMREES
jgi:hypothetical protein